MNTLQKRLANLFDHEDVSYQELQAFFRQELLALAEEVEKTRPIAAYKDYDFGVSVGITTASALIRSKADELV